MIKFFLDYVYSCKYLEYLVKSALLLLFSLKMVSFTLILDPGHGGRFKGCQNQFLEEKNITLDLAQRIAKILKKNKNIKIFLTRNQDKHLSDQLQKDLSLRTELANFHKADLFVSLHINSKADSKVRGFEIYVPYGNDSVVPIESYICAAVLHHYIAHKGDTNFVGNLGNVNGFDRGIRAAKFTVFNNISCPAVLIEWDYLSNKAVAKQLENSSYKERVATIIAQALVNYIDGYRNEKK